MKIRFLLLGTSLSLIPQTINAQCVATQDCATLGYTETSCSGGSGVKCPFGNKWACFKSESEICNDLGFTLTCTGTGEKGVGNACNGKYQSCSCDSSYQYTCSGTNQTGGSGAACSSKYTACTCASGYEWKSGSCQKQILNGPQGELYYCNGKVVGVRASDMNFYVAMKDLGYMDLSSAYSQCQSYSFCSDIKGTLPTKDQLITIYNNKSTINSLLSTNIGTKLTEASYWSSTHDYYNRYYFVHMSSGGATFNNDGNTSDYYVRPILILW